MLSEQPDSTLVHQTQAQDLPPPLYRPGDQSTPPSAASSNFSRAPNGSVVSFNGSSHRSHPSVNGIVFGGYADSVSSSPAPPGPSGSIPYPPPPVPSFPHGNNIPPAFIPPSHSHHLSEPHPYTFYPLPPNMNPYGPPQFFRRPMPHAPLPQYAGPPQQWIPPGEQAAYRAVGPDGGTPDVLPSSADGPQAISRSISAVSSQTQDRDQPRPSAEQPQNASTQNVEVSGLINGSAGSGINGSTFHDRHSTFGLPMSGQSFAATTVEEDPTPVMRDYLCSQFGNSDFADYILSLTQVYNRFPPLMLPVHSVIISRSPTMAQLIRSSGNFAYSQDGKLKILPMPVQDRFINAFAFSDALRHLYGAPLIDVHHFTQRFIPSSIELDEESLYTLEQRMDYAFAYVASGHFLRLESITSRGLDIATKLLRWETVEKALCFALDGGLGPNWRNDDSLEDRDSVSSSDDSSSKPETLQSSLTYGFYGTRLLHSIVDFLVYHLPKDFIFDSNASQLKEIPRLPATDTSRPSTSDPRLSKIQFGEVPAEEITRSSRIATTLSAILISLPFPVLKSLLEHYALGGRLGWYKVAGLMKTVIDERESRRSRVLKNRSIGTDDALARNVRWEESVEPTKQHHSGFRIARYRKGMDTPESDTSSKS